MERTKATKFLAVGHGRRLTLYVGKVLGGREAYGRNRARYLVGTGSRVIVEFAGADDYEETGRVFSILRPPRGKWYKHIWEVPEHYRRQFTIEPLANLVDDGRQHSGLAVVTHEIYPEIMAGYALQRMIDGGEVD